MKILFPIKAFYPDQGGGPSSSIYWLSKELVKAGLSVDVVVTDRGVNGMYPSDKDVLVDGINVRYCSYRFVKFPLKVIWHSLKKVRACDIVHFSSVYFFPNIIIGLYALTLKKKVIWSPRGELAANLNTKLIKKIYLKLFARFFTNKVIFHGTSEKEIVEIKSQMGESVKTVLLPNYLELPPKRDCTQDKILLYVGRINPVKALDKLIHGLSLSQKFKYSDYKMVFAGVPAGNGAIDYYNSLIDLVNQLKLNDKVEFIGHVKGEEKERLYARSYFTFLVSDTENFGNVVVESMAQGTPVVTSEGTPWKVLKEMVIGFNLSNEPKSLAAVIDTILELPAISYQTMREGAYQYCLNEFSVKQNVSKWVEIYESTNQ